MLCNAYLHFADCHVTLGVHSRCDSFVESFSGIKSDSPFGVMASKFSELDISELFESKGMTVHGIVVGDLSPIKESRNKANVRYFDGQSCDGKKTAWLVSFEPKLREELQRG